MKADGFCFFFFVDDCVNVVSVHKHVETLKLEYRADSIQLNRNSFFYCLHEL